MSKTVTIEASRFKFWGLAELIQDRKRYFHLHIPLLLSNFLGITEEDGVRIFVNDDKREILLKIEKRQK